MQEEQSTDGDLIYVRLNLRLLDKISAVDYTEILVEWKNGLWPTLASEASCNLHTIHKLLKKLFLKMLKTMK